MYIVFPIKRLKLNVTNTVFLQIVQLNVYKTKKGYFITSNLTFQIILDVKDNSFSRSRSSSVTSIDKETREAISALHFCETFTRKADSSPSPCLWVGTTLGTVLVIALNLPPGGEQRLLQPVIVSPSGAYALVPHWYWMLDLP